MMSCPPPPKKKTKRQKRKKKRQQESLILQYCTFAMFIWHWPQSQYICLKVLVMKLWENKMKKEHLINLPRSPSRCSVKFLEVCNHLLHSWWPSNLSGMSYLNLWHLLSFYLNYIKLSQLHQSISNSGTSRVEKSKLSFQSLAAIAVSAIGKLPPVLSVWEYLIKHHKNWET